MANLVISSYLEGVRKALKIKLAENIKRNKSSSSDLIAYSQKMAAHINSAAVEAYKEEGE